MSGVFGECLSVFEMRMLTGASLRQLQWWHDRGYLKPAQGILRHKRVYSAAQVDVVKRLVMLRKAGVPLAGALRYAKRSDWDTVHYADRLLLIDKILIVPMKCKNRKTPKQVGVKAPRITTRNLDKLDKLALLDPTIAAGRPEGIIRR